MKPVPSSSPESSITPEDIEDLVNRFTDNLMRGALGMGFNPSEAEELVQATFVAFYEGGQRFRGRSKILTYLFGILYNKARETRRLNKREEATEAIEEIFDNHFDSQDHWNESSMRAMSEPERKAHANQLGQLLQECLEGLSATLRMAFTLKEVQRLESPDICEVLQVTPTHLGVLLFRARNKLRECLIQKAGFIL